MLIILLLSSSALLMSEAIVRAPGSGIAASPHFLSLKAAGTSQKVYGARAIEISRNQAKLLHPCNSFIAQLL
jgi:hypothetical protein